MQPLHQLSLESRRESMMPCTPAAPTGPPRTRHREESAQSAIPTAAPLDAAHRSQDIEPPKPGAASCYRASSRKGSIPQQAAVTLPDVPETASRPCRVVVVDDNKDAADLVAIVLTLAGHHAEAAYGAADALALARAIRPDAAIIDLGMPDVDGFELARLFRADPALKDVLLVALTGWCAPGEREASAAAGFDRHLVKPADAVAIQQAIAPVCAPLRVADRSRNDTAQRTEHQAETCRRDAGSPPDDRRSEGSSDEHAPERQR